MYDIKKRGRPLSPPARFHQRHRRGDHENLPLDNSKGRVRSTSRRMLFKIGCSEVWLRARGCLLDIFHKQFRPAGEFLLVSPSLSWTFSYFLFYVIPCYQPGLFQG